MASRRLTDLKSSNRPRAGSAISTGDVVQFDKPLRGSGRTEGTVTQSGNLCDQFGRPVFRVQGADGTPYFPLQSACVRVDPAPEVEDNSSIRPFDERKGY
jgi:hypothetical protein